MSRLPHQRQPILGQRRRRVNVAGQAFAILLRRDFLRRLRHCPATGSGDPLPSPTMQRPSGTWPRRARHLRPCGTGPYATTVPFLLGRALETGELVAPADGPVSWAMPADLAEAAAIILADEGRFDGATPPLSAPGALDLEAVAGSLTAYSVGTPCATIPAVNSSSSATTRRRVRPVTSDAANPPPPDPRSRTCSGAQPRLCARSSKGSPRRAEPPRLGDVADRSAA